MSQISTVVLELLRLGPPHNQLLSPLTRYIGICGNHRAEEVCVPWEHRDFLDRLQELRYEDPREGDRGKAGQAASRERIARLHGLGRDMVQVIGHIEGLKNRLSEAHARNSEGLTHLEIVLSASELAMLPFELTRTFPGGPGSDEQFLVVQPSAQIEITRRVRGILEEQVTWPRLPKILFIAGEPDGMQVPLDAHLQALLEALRPFLVPTDGSPVALEEAVRKYLRVLDKASIDEIERVCSEEQFWYVHVLAHGMQDPSSPGQPYGLALHSAEDPDVKEIVTGDRLAAALGIGDHKPAVVTLAACDSGKITDELIHNGASLAHELHRSGVALVLGSQFPLSFEGSIELVREFYGRLPWGEDPREVVHALRRRLYARHAARTHDWASLVVYASLPDDLERQLSKVRYKASRAALDATMERLDRVLDEMAVGDDVGKQVAELEERVKATLARLPTEGEWAIEAEALRGSSSKRMAQAFFAAGAKQEGEARASFWGRCLDRLRAARLGYRKAARQSLLHRADPVVQVAVHWVLIQELSLDAVLGRPFDRERWSTALVAAQTDVSLNSSSSQLGALSSLVELYLLLFSASVGAEVLDRGVARAKALETLDRLVEEGSETVPFMLYSTRRQLQRYVDWFWNPGFIEYQAGQNIARENEQGIVELAKALIGRIPADINP